MATIVVYGGGFQPFHVGHLSSYLQAKKAFPDAAFYVAASNDTKQRPIPFKDKQFLAQQAGVKDPMVETRNPINPIEILGNYDPERDVYIIVRSERDPMPYTKKDGSPAYYQPYVKGQPMEPFSKHGYVFVTKKHTFMVGGHEIYSGTQVRDMYTNANDKGRLALIHELYPNSKQQQTIKKMLDKYLAAGPVVAPKTNAMSKLKQKKLAEQIKKIRPLLKEASPSRKEKLLQMMESLMNEYRIIPPTARVNLYYVSPKTGNNHVLAHNIPYSVVDKYLGLLAQKGYDFKSSDIVAKPVDANQYSRSSQPELAERKEQSDDFTDPESKRALDLAKQHYPGSLSKQEAFVKFVKHALQHSEEDDKMQSAQIQRLEQELAQIKQELQQPVQEGGLKNKLAAAALGTAAAMSPTPSHGIAGAFPTPSAQQAMYKAAADSNRAQAAEFQRQQNAARAAKLSVNTADVDRLNKVNYHGAGAPVQTNAKWDGDSSFMDLDGTQYTMASRMPISGDVPRDMKLISTSEGRQVYIWTRYRMKGDGGHYFYPASNPKTIDEVSDKTLMSYLTKVDADSRKHKSDPTKRPEHKASKSVSGFSQAFNKLDARKPDGSISEDYLDE